VGSGLIVEGGVNRGAGGGWNGGEGVVVGVVVVVVVTGSGNWFCGGRTGISGTGDGWCAPVTFWIADPFRELSDGAYGLGSFFEQTNCPKQLANLKWPSKIYPSCSV
jgi:hypothetical protein